MFKKLLTSFILLFCFFITIYPSKKENTNLFDYCYSLEKIIFRNSVEKSQNFSKKLKPFANDITAFGINKSRGAFAKKIIEQYKSSNNLLIISFLPNQFYCFAGYWIEKVKPGIFTSVFYEKSKQKINEYKDIKNEVDEFFKDINSEYKSIKKEISDFF
jgi:hypothetical protein